MKINRTLLTLASVVAATTMLSGTASAGKTLDAIKQKGFIQCGVNTSLPGFASADSQGNYSGLDVDICRAVATAVFGDPSKVKYSPLNASQRFTALQSGEIDILSRNTTWTLTRDASLGFNFAGVNYYDGQGFMVPKKLKIKSAKQLKNATICVQSGTTTEKNMADYFGKLGVNIKPVVFEEEAAAEKAYETGRCQVFTTDASGLASIRSNQMSVPDDHVILPEIISKEPLGPVVRRGDDEWFAVVKWTLNAMINAEEFGITSANIDDMKANSKDPNIMRIVGTGDDMGKLLGLNKDFAFNVIKQVGNYGESFERNVGKNTPLKLERGLNQLWSKGGILYAPPFR